jgi:hypothetical protein
MAMTSTCPPTMPLVTNGPFPWQCIPVWNRACAAEAKAHPAFCVVTTFGPQSWWTPLHIALAVLIGVCIAAVLIGVIAGGWIRDEARSRRYERSLGGRP